MADISYKVFGPDDLSGANADQVAELFRTMMDEFSDAGMNLSLAKDGEKTWAQATQRGLGSFSFLAVAMCKGSICGFIHAGLKVAPSYLDAGKIGVISYIYIKPKCRRKGVARSLWEKAGAWFAENRVSSVELQVLENNIQGDGFWRSLGFDPELRQYRLANLTKVN